VERRGHVFERRTVVREYIERSYVSDYGHPVPSGYGYRDTGWRGGSPYGYEEIPAGQFPYGYGGVRWQAPPVSYGYDEAPRPPVGIPPRFYREEYVE
jgi:hypothetical protein